MEIEQSASINDKSDEEIAKENEFGKMQTTAEEQRSTSFVSDRLQPQPFNTETFVQSKQRLLSLYSVTPSRLREDPSILNYHAWSGSEINEQENVTNEMAGDTLDLSRSGGMTHEVFPVNVTPLMNDDQLWGCFYPFSDLYKDIFSPVVVIRKKEDVPEPVNNVLTHELISVCLSYLKRTPILGDFVCIKLVLSGYHLVNIQVLMHYKYLVYLDLSTNSLTELTVLSNLPYLQFLSVSCNQLTTVLDYEVPQWYLTEVHYKNNFVKKIRDLTLLWSITWLDLSYNGIEAISGLEKLYYLRNLNLSYNCIQRLENLNGLRLISLDVSNNNISTFEHGDDIGLQTLRHLEYLNLNENKLTSLKLFSGCTRLRKLFIRQNKISILLELAIYMKQLTRLSILDLRDNPICDSPGYGQVIVNTFPMLLNLDGEDFDPVLQRRLKMRVYPGINAHACDVLLRLLYIEQLARARVLPHVPPADTAEVPLVVFVGYEAVGKGALIRRLAKECHKNVVVARLHTTASFHGEDIYREISRSQFDDMLLAGDFLTYYEQDGESYGLSREEAYIEDGILKVVSMDLVSALMLKQRGRRPYLILVTVMDKVALSQRQQERQELRHKWLAQRIARKKPEDQLTLQVMTSRHMFITGILNEVLMSLPERKEFSEFILDSTLDIYASNAVQNYSKEVNTIALMSSVYSPLQWKSSGVKIVYDCRSAVSGEAVDENASKILKANTAANTESIGVSSKTGVIGARSDTKYDDPELIMKQLTYYQTLRSQMLAPTIKDDYDSVHRKLPGLFWDTITMDDPEEAFQKAKRIVREIYESQSDLKPMFEIDFEEMTQEYPTIKKRIEIFAKDISSTRYYT